MQAHDAPVEASLSRLLIDVSNYVGWADDLKIAEAFEVRFVEGEKMRHFVNGHHGGQHRVVNLYAFDPMQRDQSSPFLMRGQAFRQEPKLSLDQLCLSLYRFMRKSKPATRRNRARANIPEFNDNLRRVAEVFVAAFEFLQSFKSRLPIRVVSFRQAKKDICVYQVGHLVVIKVNVFPIVSDWRRGQVFRTLG